MKKVNYFGLLAFVALSFSSCQIVGDIFKAGMWVGIISVIIVVALVIWLIRKVL